MGSFQKKKKSTIKQYYKKLLHILEFSIVLLALMLPMYLLSSQIGTVNIANEKNQTCSLQEWLQSLNGFIEHL